MRALKPVMRRFVMAALQFPTGKDWQLAKAAGYADKSYGSLRVTAHRLLHDERVIAAMREEADKRLRGYALLGISVIAQIARNDKHPDQLKAAMGLANRLGFHEMSEHKVSVEHKQPKEITELAIKLAKEIGIASERLLGNNRGVIEGEFVEVSDGSSG